MNGFRFVLVASFLALVAVGAKLSLPLGHTEENVVEEPTQTLEHTVPTPVASTTGATTTALLPPVSTHHTAEKKAVALPVFTAETLKKYDGEDASLPIYIAFDGNVYDVSEGRKFYQPGGTYHFLAGTDGTTLLKRFGGDIIRKKYPVVGTYR